MECAFGVSVHFSSLSLSFVDENPAAGESALHPNVEGALVAESSSKSPAEALCTTYKGNAICILYSVLLLAN